MKYVKCVMEHRFLTVGKEYNIYDKTRVSIRVRNDKDVLRYIPLEYFEKVGLYE